MKINEILLSDWIGIYFDNKLVCEGHSLHFHEFIIALKKYTEVNGPIDNIEFKSKDWSDVIPEDEDLPYELYDNIEEQWD